jgi:hypothetical protein
MQVAMNGSTVATGTAILFVAHVNGAITLSTAAGFTSRLASTGLEVQDDYFASAFPEGTVTETFNSADVYVVAGQTLVDGGTGNPPTPDTPPSDTGTGLCTGIQRYYLGQGAFNYGGTGVDGAIHMDGVSAVPHCTLSGGIYTATASTNSTSVLIDVGVTFYPGNFNHFCQGDVTNNGLVDASGQDGSPAIVGPPNLGGAAGADGRGTTSGNLPKLTTRSGIAVGGQGGAPGVNSNGANGADGLCGGTGGTGGNASHSPGGSFVGGSPGAGGSQSRFTCPADIAAFVAALASSPSSIAQGVTTTNAGGGGGGGGGAAVDGISGGGTGGGGGGRAGNGEWIAWFANRFLGTGIWRSKGGKGGDGGNGHGGSEIGGSAGGGAGGAPGAPGCGGLIALVSLDLPSVTVDISAGSAGLVGSGAPGQGSGSSSGTNATASAAGLDGLALLVATNSAPVSPVTVTFSLGSIAGVTQDNQALLLMPAFNAGDRRAQKRFGDLFMEAQVALTSQINVALWSGQYSSTVAGYSPAALTPQNGGLRSPYLIDFASGDGFYAVDLEAAISWELGTDTSLVTWQPTVIPQPEGIQNRPTDWDSANSEGAKFYQGLLLEANTFGQPKTFVVESADDLSQHTPTEVPATFNGQSIIPFSFANPFIAHSVRIKSTDNVPWQIFGVKWIFKPFPEQMIQWVTEGISHGLKGWQHIFFANIGQISTADLTLTLTLDGSRTLSVNVPNSGGVFQKTKVPIGQNKFKTCAYRIDCDSSNAPFRVFFKDLEIYCREWGSAGPYSVVRPFGGDSEEGAEV